MKRRFALAAVLLILVIASTSMAEISLGTTEEIALPERYVTAVHAFADGSFLLKGKEGMDRPASALAWDLTRRLARHGAR